MQAQGQNCINGTGGFKGGGEEKTETNEYQEEEIQTTFKRNVRFMGGIEKFDACSSSVLSLEAQQVPSGRLLPHSSALETS